MNEIIVKGLIVVQDILAGLRERSKRASQGQSLVEYALILAFIALVVIVAMKLLQPAVAGTFNRVTNCLNNSGTPVVPGSTPTPCS